MTDQPIHEEIDLRGQVALVTGGGRGLGQHLATALAGAGAAVAIVGRSAPHLTETVRLIEGGGGQALAFPADVTDQQAVERVVAATEQRLGPIDLLVNNAGVLGPVNGPLWEVDPMQWWRTIDINLRGPFLCARAVLPGMVSRRAGRIINMTSPTGQHPYLTAYKASKTALTDLTNCLAAETQPYGISVFAFMPGGVRSGMTEYLAASSEVHESIRSHHQAYFREGITVDVPERAVQVCLLLASGKADALSGRYISAWDDALESLKRVEEILQNDLLTVRVRPLTTSGDVQRRYESLLRGSEG
jgi:NAD(P)-dependent dehydrogenase (short-subunit alcohol dehydrogenase family)